MAIHLEMEYAKRFEGRGQGAGGDMRDDSGRQGDGDGDGNVEGGGEGGGEAEKGNESSTEADRLEGPLPDKVDVSWAHILVQHQVCGGGCDPQDKGPSRFGFARIPAFRRWFLTSIAVPYSSFPENTHRKSHPSQ